MQSGTVRVAETAQDSGGSYEERRCGQEKGQRTLAGLDQRLGEGGEVCSFKQGPSVGAQPWFGLSTETDHRAYFLKHGTGDTIPRLPSEFCCVLWLDVGFSPVSPTRAQTGVLALMFLYCSTEAHSLE